MTNNIQTEALIKRYCEKQNEANDLRRQVNIRLEDWLGDGWSVEDSADGMVFIDPNALRYAVPLHALRTLLKETPEDFMTIISTRYPI